MASKKIQINDQSPDPNPQRYANISSVKRTRTPSDNMETTAFLQAGDNDKNVVQESTYEELDEPKVTSSVAQDPAYVKLDDPNVAYIESLGSVHGKPDDPDAVYVETQDPVDGKLDDPDTTYAETQDPVDDKLDVPDAAYAETQDPVDGKLDDPDAAYAETQDPVDGKLDDPDAAYAETQDPVDGKLDDPDADYAETQDPVDFTSDDPNATYAELDEFKMTLGQGSTVVCNIQNEPLPDVKYEVTGAPKSAVGRRTARTIILRVGVSVALLLGLAALILTLKFQNDPPLISSQQASRLKCNIVEIKNPKAKFLCQYATLVDAQRCETFCTEVGGQIISSTIEKNWEDIEAAFNSSKFNKGFDVWVGIKRQNSSFGYIDGGMLNKTIGNGRTDGLEGGNATDCVTLYFGEFGLSKEPCTNHAYCLCEIY